MSHPVTAISDDELQRLADLAQLQLPTGSGREQLAEQLGEIVAYVSSVQASSSGASSAPPSAMVERADVPQADPAGQVGPSGKPRWLDQSSLAEGQLVAVPGIFTSHGSDGA